MNHRYSVEREQVVFFGGALPNSIPYMAHTMKKTRDFLLEQSFCLSSGIYFYFTNSLQQTLEGKGLENFYQTYTKKTNNNSIQ